MADFIGLNQLEVCGISGLVQLNGIYSYEKVQSHGSVLHSKYQNINLHIKYLNVFKCVEQM